MRQAAPAALLIRLLLAAGSLLAGLDLHALEIGAPRGAWEAPDGEVQAHADDCPHHVHLPPAHEPHGCNACKAGAARAAALVPDAAVRPAPVAAATVDDSDEQVVRATRPGGTLGARGPPGTHG